MAVYALIFNGLHFYFPLAEEAFSRAKQSNGSVIALFLKARHESKKGYFFPSDLDAAENVSTNDDAESDDKKIIESNIRMLQHQAVTDHVKLRTQMLEDPSVEEFQKEVNGCEIIFIQSDKNDPENMPIAGIDVKKLLSNITIPVKMIK